MNENEQKMNRFLFAFVEILEWLTEGAHISKNQIHYIVNEAAISCNVGVTTFGPPCTLKFFTIEFEYLMYAIP